MKLLAIRDVTALLLDWRADAESHNPTPDCAILRLLVLVSQLALQLALST
jgi:hypothetical protein